MVILSKGCKPDNFESHSYLKLSFTNIHGFIRIFLNVNLSFNQLLINSPDILALREANLDDSIDSGNFSVGGYLPLIRKDSITLSMSCSLCEGRTSFCTGFISKKPCAFLLMFSTGFISLGVLFVFPLLINFFIFMHSF